MYHYLCRSFQKIRQRQKNKVSRRYNDFVALHELLTLKYPYRLIPTLPPKKTVNGFYCFFELLLVDQMILEQCERELSMLPDYLFSFLITRCWNCFTLFLVDKEFIEERRRSLKRYLQILCRHPSICDSDIIKFFLTYQGTVRIFQQTIISISTSVSY